MEQELLAAWIADRAKRVSAVVMDPYSGEIWPTRSYPSYDANDYQAIAADRRPARFVDPIVSTVYEPGSVFKMLTATAALGDGTVTPRDEVQATSARCGSTAAEPKSTTPTTRRMGGMTFQDAIAYSRNVVAAKVALELGRTTARRRAILYATWTPPRASGRRPASTSPTRCRASSATRPRRRGARSTSPTARSARASR